LWAYYTLGFGGYWAWDPVEVANLLPWLAFTVYLHAQLHHARHGSYRAMGPFLAALPFLLTLFSTISTRSGLWVSVHAFTDPTDTFNPDAAGRFLDILRVEPTLSFYVGLFFATFALLLALWSRRLAAEQGRLRMASRAIAAAFASFAAFALVAPVSALSGLLEASWRVMGSAGLGLLGLAFLSCFLAALPLLVGPGQPAESPKRKPRRGLGHIHMRSLAAYAVLALGVALLVLFLFHVAAAQRGSTAGFYEERFPYLALPVTLGLIVFQGHQAFGRRRSVEVAAAALLVAAAAWAAARGVGQFRLAQGLALGIPALVLVVVAFVRIRRAGTPPGTPRTVRRADTLLLIAALLDLLFWLDPPTLRIGTWAWTPVWPAQAVFGALAIAVLWGAVLGLVGHPRRSGALHLAAAALGGFYVAPLLAAASWLLRRGQSKLAEPLDGRGRARLHQVALYGVHFAIALALLGYAPSTYFKEQAAPEFAPGQAVRAAGHDVTFLETRTDAAAGYPADTLWQDFAVHGQGETDAILTAELRWEQDAGAYYPLPSTARSWSGDFYLDVEAVHVAAGSPCLGGHPGGAWVEAYRAGSPSRVCGGDRIDAVRATVASLPGIGLLWLALAVGVAGMAALMASQPIEDPAARRRAAAEVKLA
ncbi:MAG: cytochrome c biogenesis protein CcsA, partial [Halobacteriales archaeon]|nr:cytochrome c biogenesis protein CcsA [Halobacteriales archaeon]